MASVRITALSPGDGECVAELWRDLWILHESWDGYPAARDRDTYRQLAERLEGWAERRKTDPVLGQHVHLVARNDAGMAIGQIEGWLERHGLSPDTPATCEVRSLIVDERVRAHGVGRALLGELELLVRQVCRGPTFLVAEVLVPNSALGFYEQLGYRAIATTMMMPLDRAPLLSGVGSARLARPSDAMAMTHLEMQRRHQARARGDCRLDRPTALDAAFAQAVARHLASSSSDLLSWDGSQLMAQASLTTSTLEAPFAPVVRAALGRLAMHHGGAASVGALLALAGERAGRRGGRRLEVSDLPTDEHDPLRAILREAGARPFSWIMGRLLP